MLSVYSCRAGCPVAVALGIGLFLSVATAMAADPSPPASSRQVASPSMSNWKWLQRLLAGGSGNAGSKSTPASVTKDPTAMSAELRKLLEAEQEAKATPAQQAPAAQAAPVYNIPKIGLKALVVGSGTNPSAVLAIGEKGTMIVRAGVEYPLSDGPNKITMIVHEIKADRVDLEIKPAGQKLVLH